MNLSASAPAHPRDEAMIVVTFPDQTTRSFRYGVTGAEIAAEFARVYGLRAEEAVETTIAFLRELAEQGLIEEEAGRGGDGAAG